MVPVSFVWGFCAVFVIVNISVFQFGLIICVCLSLCVSVPVGVDVSVPDGSVKKNSSGESRNRDRSQRASSDPQLKDLCGSHTLEQTVGAQHCVTLLFLANSKQSKSSGKFPRLYVYCNPVLAAHLICL